VPRQSPSAQVRREMSGTFVRSVAADDDGFHTIRT
jgi:hypothetical protein